MNTTLDFPAVCLRLAFVVLATCSCNRASATAPASDTDFRAAYTRPAGAPQNAANPSSPQRIALGKMLFFDPRLSGSNVMSCATCHNPSFAWADHLPVGVGSGHHPLGRHTPTILNAAFNDLQMWDGRFNTLEQQALGPMLSPAEMHSTPELIVSRLSNVPRYVELFHEAYGESGITADNIAKAIGSFERTIISAEAPFDRYVAGDNHAISPAAIRGFTLFNTKANCVVCHSGWNFTDSSFHDIGVTGDDLGRGPIIRLDSMNHAFKTPTLRNIDQRAPYTHNGSEPSIESVIELYNQGGRAKRPTLSGDIKPLGLSAAEVSDLTAFLHTLTSHDPAVTLPELP